jgi:hypothetical protein
MPRKRQYEEDGIPEDIPNLPEGWKILIWEKGDTAVVRIKKDDIERIRILKLPKEVREYLRDAQTKFRARHSGRNNGGR